MKLRILYILLLPLLAVTTLTGCFRDELTFPKLGQIELKIDWSRSALSANSATVLIYQNGVYYSTEIISAHPPIQKFVTLPEGVYDFVVYNEQAQDFSKSLTFSGTEKLGTIQASPLDEAASLRATTKAYKVSMDTLATDRQMGVEISKQMIEDSYSKTPSRSTPPVLKTILFTPRRNFTAVSVVVRVTNGNGYHFAKNSPASLQGMASAYMLGNDTYSDKGVEHSLQLAPTMKLTEPNVVEFKGDILAAGLAGRTMTPATAAAIAGEYMLHLPFTSGGKLELRSLNLNKEAKTFKFTPEDPKDPKNNYDRLEIEVDVTLPVLESINDIEVGLDDWDDVDIPLDGPQYLYFVANNGSNESFRMTNNPGVYINMPLPTIFTPIGGVNFKSWNTNKDGSGTAYEAGAPFMMQRGTTIFYGRWEIETN